CYKAALMGGLKCAPGLGLRLYENSPSQMVESTGRPDRFLALHFANEIWKNNTAEVMRHASTSETVFDAVVQFAKSIGMVALPIHKEQPGYILNSLLVPFLDAAQKLWFNGVAGVETIDRTWMIATGAPQGPFAILDVVGLNTVYNIAMARAEASQNPLYRQIAERLKRDYIDQGKLGRQSGEGFYRYPDPAFREPNFTKG
ncbi:3-hydroxyacyl-CoA dehydrogenase family protein, partial [Sulfobacillus harzensis]